MEKIGEDVPGELGCKTTTLIDYEKLQYGSELHPSRARKCFDQ